jgi:hypothetical protein
MTAPTSSGTGICGAPFLWVLCLAFLSTVCYFSNYKDSTQFILLFFSVFVGGFVVMFNIRVLGGQISFFQAVAILGYCLFPLFAVALDMQIMKLIQFFKKWVRLIMICVACLWCILCNYLSKTSFKSFCGSQRGRRQKICSNVPDYSFLHIFGCSSHVYVIFYFGFLISLLLK